MPGSQTARDPSCTCDDVQTDVAFHLADGVGAPENQYFAAQWLAYSHPCQRFAPYLTVRHA